MTDSFHLVELIQKLRRTACYSVFLFSLLLIRHGLHAQETPYERNGKNYTATYSECIDYYRLLDKKYACVSMQEMGMTDAGLPLHVVLISGSRKQEPSRWKQENKLIILINNGIHPGEPDGIDASMMLVRDLANLIQSGDGFPSNVALAFIPIYNIGGCLNRSPYHRVDQNGPEAFGSRGNSQNLDLNRDFIKCDSKEARSFAALFHWIQPDIFIDNHVSDGADYQHVMTLASTQHNKLGGVMGDYLHRIFEPALYEDMAKKSIPMIPYVNVWGKDAKDGWSAFFDGPRYSSGYASLFNVFSFTAETHMLKAYPLRVNATYEFMRTMIDVVSGKADTIHILRKQMLNDQLQQTSFPLDWRSDREQFEEINYKGYQYKTQVSKVSNLPVKMYDRADPYETKVKFYNTYTPGLRVEAPKAYIIPQGWWPVIDLLRLNGIEMQEFSKDDSMEFEVYYITKYKSSEIPYEEHHPNQQVEVKKVKEKIFVRAGDYYISTAQEKKRFIIEVLEPQGNDGYFAWNFFDAILIQKEGYSNYAYEEYAAQYLNEHPELRRLLNNKRQSDTAFAGNAAAQLDFVYKNSPYKEEGHNRYPVYRYTGDTPVLSIPEQTTANPAIRIKEDE